MGSAHIGSRGLLKTINQGSFTDRNGIRKPELNEENWTSSLNSGFSIFNNGNLTERSWK
jgi:hypothetical protein